MALYPAPNVEGSGSYNYQTTTVSNTNLDNVQSRLSHGMTNRDSLLVTSTYQRTNTEAANMFGFVDSNTTSNLDTTVNWSHRFNQFFTLRIGYQFLRQTNDSTPHFANRANISGEAGIRRQQSGAGQLGAAESDLLERRGRPGDGPVRATDEPHHTGSSSEALWRTRGGHNLTFGGAVRPQTVHVLGQQNARGTFGFDGSVTGSALADFLLGAPHSAALAFGNADKLLHARSLNAYMTDDWRINPTLTLELWRSAGNTSRRSPSRSAAL